jgi:hypothetical protein
MAPGHRKNILMFINLYSIEFILEYHKKISSQIKACKNNLTMLHEREAELRSELLSEEILTELVDEREEIDTHLKGVIKTLYQLEEKISVLKTETSCNIDLDQIRAQCQKVYKNLSIFKEVPREDIIFQKEDTRSKIDTLKAHDSMYFEQITTLIEEISRYQDVLERLKDQEDTQDLENTLETLRATISLKSQCISDITDPFTRTRLPVLKEKIDMLQSLTSFFIGISTALLQSGKLKLKQNSLYRRSEQIKILEGQRDHYTSQCQDLSRELDISLDDLPKTNCSFDICPLYSAFVLKHDVVHDKLSKLKEALRKIDHKLKRRQFYVDHLSEQLQEQHPYVPKILDIVTLLREYPELNSKLEGLKLLNTLQSNPVHIYHILHAHYEGSQCFYEVEDLKAEYLNKLEIKEKLEKTDTSEITFTENLLNEKMVTLNTLRCKQDRTTNDIAYYEHLYSKLCEYEDTLKWVDDTSIELDTFYEISRQSHLKDLYCDLLDIGQDAKDHYLKRMGVIDHTLRHQEILSAKYTGEIKHQIKKILKKKEKLEYIEKALSPKDGIPHKYTVSFVNSLIERMNLYIDLVFSYPFEVIPVDLHDPLDYKFKAQSGDIIVPDISLCSDAQKEMIDLAFMLSVIYHLNLSKYPISLDEIGKGFDHYHKQNLLTLFTEIVDQNLVSQMFIVNHHSAIWSGLSNSDILVLSDKNILTPTHYNDHVVLKTYANL